MEERWRSVVGWEGFYEVSDHGRVRSIQRTIEMRDGVRQVRRGRLLDPKCTAHSYAKVRLSRPGERVERYVHRLVAAAFIGPSNGLYVLHCDGNPRNNALSNLRYGTQKDNMADALAHGWSNRGERHGASRLTREKVLAIYGAEGLQKEIGARFGIAQQTVSEIKSGKTWAWLRRQPTQHAAAQSCHMAVAAGQ
jgi:hypothetical protein